MIDEWNDNQDEIFCDFTFSNIPDNLSDSLKISLYRIIQESLTNVLKYSQASKVIIKIKYKNSYKKFKFIYVTRIFRKFYLIRFINLIK